MKIEGVKDYETFKAFKVALKEDVRVREEALRERLHKVDDFVGKSKRIGESVLSPLRNFSMNGISGTVGLLSSLFLSRRLKKRLAITMGILQAVRITPGIVRSVVSVLKTLKKKENESHSNE